MPELRKIAIQNFRNIELQDVSFSPNVNCISGGNGEGKTNLLDAIWYLSMTKSAVSGSDRFNFRYGTSEFSLCGTYSMPGGTVSSSAYRSATPARSGCGATTRHTRASPPTSGYFL